MALFGYSPVKPGAAISDPGRDKRGARAIEQYYLGEKAIYLPGPGFGWRYLPYSEIRGVIPGHETLKEDSVLVRFERDKPTLRLIYQGGAEILSLESVKNAETMLMLLKNRRPGSQAFYEEVLHREENSAEGKH